VVRVLLDATAIPANRGGVGRYVDNLIPALSRAGIDLRVVCQARDVEHLRAIGNTEPIAAPRSTARVAARLVWEQAGLPTLIRQLKPDVVHAPHYTQPLATRRP